MIHGRGVTVAALLVGCAGGVAFREVVFPAHAAAGASYAYKIVSSLDLIGSVQAKNPQLKDADARQALEEGMRGFGAGGWRYVGCLPAYAMNKWGAGVCDHLVFELANGAATAPPARATLPEPPSGPAAGSSTHP